MRFFTLTLAVLLLSCSASNNATSKLEKKQTLLGTWDLVSYVDHEESKTEWQEYPQHILYQKHVTGTHFTWIRYNKEKDQLEGMGGGNYHFRDGKYVENIEYFYPPGAGILGQSIPFEAKVKNDQWQHTGYIREMELDFEEAAMVQGDSVKIEEIWVRSSASEASNQQLAGTWDLKLYRDNPEESYYEYPELTGYLKLITDTHFVWIKYDQEGDQIYGAGCGTYDFNGEQYTENIQMFYPSGSTLLGTSITFNAEINDYQWKHLGYGEGEDAKILIDEVWISHVNTIEEEVAVSF
ncbi:MAG: hypothetical protein AAGA85_10610 [Bacteroidota bacterium]